MELVLQVGPRLAMDALFTLAGNLAQKRMDPLGLVLALQIYMYSQLGILRSHTIGQMHAHRYALKWLEKAYINKSYKCK